MPRRHAMTYPTLGPNSCDRPSPPSPPPPPAPSAEPASPPLEHELDEAYMEEFVELGTQFMADAEQETAAHAMAEEDDDDLEGCSDRPNPEEKSTEKKSILAP